MLYRQSPALIACAGPHFHHKVSLLLIFGVPAPISSWIDKPDLNKYKEQNPISNLIASDSSDKIFANFNPIEISGWYVLIFFSVMVLSLSSNN